MPSCMGIDIPVSFHETGFSEGVNLNVATRRDRTISEHEHKGHQLIVRESREEQGAAEGTGCAFRLTHLHLRKLEATIEMVTIRALRRARVSLHT